MNWKIGDSIRILNNYRIIGGAYCLSSGGIYEIEDVTEEGVVITDDCDSSMTLTYSDLKSVEIVKDTVLGADHDAEYEEEFARNAELGEPSPECNCAELSDIREELTDIKSMIGRLLQREQAEVDTLYAHRLNGVKFATGEELAEKASAVIDGEESE